MSRSLEVQTPQSGINGKNAITNKESSKRHLDEINLEIFPGEIVGIAGVEGNGQTELIQVLTGLRHIDSGTLTSNSERIAHVPADRHRHGISLNDRIDDNFIIGHHKTDVSVATGCFSENQSSGLH